MTTPGKEHRFNDTELARVLKRAIELDGRLEAADETRLLPSPPPDGLTLREVLEIGAEVGIDPARVVQAVDALSVEGWSSSARVFGGPIRLRSRRTLLKKVAPGRMGSLLEIVRESLGVEGESHEVLGGVEWKGKKGQDSVTVRIVPGGGRTVLHLDAERGLSAFLSHYLPILASLGVAGITIGVFEPLSGSAMTGVVLGWTATGYLAARTIWAAGTRKWRRLLDHVMDRMTTEADED